MDNAKLEAIERESNNCPCRECDIKKALVRKLRVLQRALENAISDGTEQRADMDDMEHYIEVAERELFPAENGGQK